MKVLIVEDDADIARILSEFLSAHHHETDWAGNVGSALQLLETTNFDVIILDRGLPRLEGLRLLQLLRMDMGSNIPVLVLTAKDSEADKLEGLNAGADDYVVKPFSLAEVEARLRVLARRGPSMPSAPASRGLHYDAHRHELSINGQAIHPQPKVAQLLILLARHPSKFHSHQDIEEALWGEIQNNSDKLRQVIYQARKLLAQHSSGSRIVTVHGNGIRLEVTP